MSGFFLDTTMPLYVQLAELMRQRISKGVWSGEGKLPSLDQLTLEFKVARVTVRQAIDLLAKEGILSPKQGRGTFITGGAPPERIISVETSLSALEKMFENTETQMVELKEAVAAPITSKDGEAAASYTYMRRVHYNSGQPYCVINIYLESAIYRRAPDRFQNTTVISVLKDLRGVKIASAHQVLTVGAAALEVARLLSLPFRGPVAEVRRVFKDERGRVIYLAEVTYRGDLIRLEMELKV